MASLPKLVHEGKAYVARAAARVLLLEALIQETDAIRAQGLEVVFVEQLPSIASVRSVITSLKNLNNNMTLAVAALAVLHPGTPAEATIARIQELSTSLVDFKVNYGKYRFEGGEVNTSLATANYKITAKQVQQLGWHGYAVTISGLRKIAKPIIEYWLEAKTTKDEFKLGSRCAEMRNNGTIVKIGCQDIPRKDVESIFVALGYLDEAGNILITD